jgi:SAM-dependent methyltransferase
MDRYYPPDYYSYAPRPYNRLAGWLKGCRDRHYLGKFSLVGRLVSRFSAAPTYIEWLANLELAPGASILDVGCGSGTLIANLKDAGFQATGIDPYIAGQIVHANGARVLKQSLAETTGSYDCLMLHHCLEHMDSPREAFKQIDRLLQPSGRLLIRIPVTGTYAWRTYGEHWFQLDAPRHAVLFTEDALCALAGKYGFQLRRIVYDSTASQFWGSEEYLQGIAHMSTASYGINPGGSVFTSGQVEEFAARAQELNNSNDGDQAAFYFTRVSS